GRNTNVTKDQRWLEFTGTFAFWSENRQREVFESIWNHPTPTHAMLVDLVCDPRQRRTSTDPRPGAPCPLCGFPTFAWASLASLAESTASAIRSEFPHWTLEQGACARCVQIYRANRPHTSAVI